MAVYGIKTYDSVGRLELDSTAMIGWRLSDTIVVAKRVSTSKDYSAIYPAGYTLIAIPTCRYAGACHQVTVSGYTVTVTAIDDKITGNYVYSSPETIILVFLR